MSERLPVDDLPAEAFAIARTVRELDRFAVTSHVRPDGDAIGSSLACAEMLRNMGKQCDIVFADPIPQMYLTLPGVSEIQQASGLEAGRYDAVIILECDGAERSGLSGLDATTVINIDHHITGCDYGDLNWIDHSASAVAVLVYGLARALQTPVTQSMATCLYTAVFTDTGAFTYPGTAGNALPFAQALIAHGADADRIARDVLYSVSSAHIRLLGTALSRLQIQGATAWSYVTQADLLALGATDDDSEGTVNYLISIAGVDTALFLREVPQDAGAPQRFRVSLRSKSELDVSCIAAANGGGGHQRAAGCSIEGPLERAVRVMLAGLEQSRFSLAAD